MTTTVDAGSGLPAWPGDVPAPARAREQGAQPDDLVALLQAFQAAQITPRMVEDAQRRLRRALQSAQLGHPPDAQLLLRQVATDLGITLSVG